MYKCKIIKVNIIFYMDPNKNIREPIRSVYQKDVTLQESNNMIIDDDDDDVLLNSIKCYTLIKLINYNLLLLNDNILNELRDIKRIVSIISVEYYKILLNSEWHKKLFRNIDCSKDELLWHLNGIDSDLICIYEGKFIINMEILNNKLLNKPNYILLSDRSGPCILWCLLLNSEIVITFPILAIKIFKINDYNGKIMVINNVLYDREYDITCYYNRN